jgi:TfoX/Sxy family transcriptional regulator of competence genes
MAFDEKLAERVRVALRRRQSVEERRMFGGLAFLVRGHMCCGVLKNELVVRVHRDELDHLLREPHARVMDFTGRPSKNMLYVSAAGLEDDRALGTWLKRGLDFVRTLPAKAPSRGSRGPR